MEFHKSRLPFLWKYKMSYEDKYHYSTLNKLVKIIVGGKDGN